MKKYSSLMILFGVNNLLWSKKRKKKEKFEYKRTTRRKNDA